MGFSSKTTYFQGFWDLCQAVRVDALDIAFARDPDPEKNRILFSNQTVAEFAAASMILMGWTN
jgi:hypothetical protein